MALSFIATPVQFSPPILAVKSLATTFIVCLVLGWDACWAQTNLLPLASALVGGRFDYGVQAGDSLIRVSARVGESAGIIAQDSGIPLNSRLFPGQRLSIDNRHIVPAAGIDDGIVINLPQRMLFYFQDAALAGAYPVGLGRPTWPTPAGEFQVVEKRRNPTWHVPASIQEEMRLEGKAVRTEVPPGDGNPLGAYWIGLSIRGYGIHATNAPASVYRFRSHGCIRLHPDDAESLYSQVGIGTGGKIVYAPLLLARLGDGRIFLEVNRDIYHKGGDTLRDLKQLAEENGLTNQIDWQRAGQVVELQEGLARRIDLTADGF